MSKPRKLRRAGAVWRLLVHRHGTDGPFSDMAYHVQSDRIRDRGDDSPHSTTTVLERTEFDELVVGDRLIHIEQQATGTYWMSVGGVVLWVKANRDGRPTSVSVYGPGAYESPLPGCTYDLDWRDEDEPSMPDRPADQP